MQMSNGDYSTSPFSSREMRKDFQDIDEMMASPNAVHYFC